MENRIVTIVIIVMISGIVLADDANDAPFQVFQKGSILPDTLICAPPEALETIMAATDMCEARYKIDVQKEKDICEVRISALIKARTLAEDASRKKIAVLMDQLNNSTDYKYIIWTVTGVGVLLGIAGAIYILR